MRAPHVVGFDFKTGYGIAAGLITQHQRIAALITVCLLRGRIDFDHASPDNTGVIPQDFFVKQVAVSPLCFMMLLCVITDLLAITGERYAVHFGSGSTTVQIDVLMNVRQFAAQTDNRPLQRSVAAHDAGLMREMPGILIPVLQLHVSQICIPADDQFDTTNMQTGDAF